jgi:hypothetical protein
MVVLNRSFLNIRFPLFFNFGNGGLTRESSTPASMPSRISARLAWLVTMMK